MLKMRDFFSRFQQGFTMVEVVIAVMIFSLSMAGLLAAISILNKPSSESVEQVQAAYLAKELLEELRMHVEASSWDDPLSPLAVSADPIGGTVARQGIDFQRFYTVSADPSGGRWVTVTVNWE